MALSARDTRHIFLVSLIIAALPMLVYPNSLGFDIGLGSALYLLCELVFFAGVALAVDRDRAPMRIVSKTFVFFGGRLFMSLVFCAYLLLMERVPIAEAFDSGFMGFKPAVFLFSLTAPFVFGSFARALLGSGNGRRMKMNQERKIIDGSPRPAPSINVVRESTPIHSPQPRTGNDYFDRSFNEAVAHVGQYSGVNCAMLVDSEGLAVAAWNRGKFEYDMWGALSRKIVDQISETCEHGGGCAVDSLEFRSGNERFYMQRVADMWLVSIADAASDELEKIRVIQAIDMITRHLNEKYKNVYMTEAGRMYAGSTV